MHITNQNKVLIYLRLQIYKIYSWNMIFTYYPNDFCHKRNILTHTVLAIAYKYTRATYDYGFVFQGHICAFTS